MAVPSRPAIWLPDMPEEIWEQETDEMMLVAMGFHLYETKQISFDQLEDILNENGVDPIAAVESWMMGNFKLL